MPEPVFFQHFEVLRDPDGRLRELGRGAMGITYKAFDTNLHAPVALKIINAELTDDAKARERFLREARAAARLRHPNVATVLHLGQQGENCFYAMEFIEGETLEAYVARQGPLAPVLALNIAAQTARALGAAHMQGLVHRDIKPANIMLARHRGEEDEEGVHVKVIDFGLAKFIEKERLGGGSTTSGAGGGFGGSMSLTMAGAFVGSPYFASPEQIEEGDIDIRSDIYSLGVTMWYLLVGKPPFVGSLGQIMAQHLQRPPPLDDLRRRGAPDPLCDLLERLLAKSREDRPADPAILRRELVECLRAVGAAASTPAAAATVATVVKVAADSTPGAGPEFAPPGTPVLQTFAGRYDVAADLGKDDVGAQLYKAADRRDAGRWTLLRRLPPGRLPADAGRTVGRIARADVQGLVNWSALEPLPDGDVLLIGEWLEGFRLTEILRARQGRVSVPEALGLLQRAAATVDDAEDAELFDLDLSLHGMRVCFPEGLPAGEAGPALAGRPTREWPPYELKIDALALARPAVPPSGSRTLLPTRSLPRASGAIGGAAANVWALAEAVYESLGGTLPAPGVPRYPPLAELPEAANAVLRRALLAGAGDGSAGPAFSGARQFAVALFAAASSGSGSSVIARAAAAGAGPGAGLPAAGGPLPPFVPMGNVPGDGGATSVLPEPFSSPPASTPPQRRRRWGMWLGVFFVGGMALLAALGAGAYLIIAAINRTNEAEDAASRQHRSEDPVPTRRALPVDPSPSPTAETPASAGGASPAPSAAVIVPGVEPEAQIQQRIRKQLEDIQRQIPSPPQSPPKPEPEASAYPDTPLAVYRARLSARDHLSSSGQRLTAVSDILRQDRANLHRFRQSDPEDQDDPIFNDARTRKYFDAVEFRPGSVSEAVVQGTPLVEVAVYQGRVLVTVLSR